jgi:hypothetical protein
MRGAARLAVTLGTNISFLGAIMAPGASVSPRCPVIGSCSYLEHYISMKITWPILPDLEDHALL